MKSMKKAMYKHEVDEPMVPPHGDQEGGMGLMEMKKEAMDIAYGQAGEAGCRSDMKKMSAQMKHYDWESPSEY